jgi:type IV secretion system protein VirB6
MGGACPAYGPGDPLVASLLGVVDCNVQTLIASGYGALFDPRGVFVPVLTVGLTLYVALVGYRLMLGRSPMTVTDFTLTAVKLGVVLALATQWGAYQQVVYRVLFHGPQQIADVILRTFDARGFASGGGVFDGLQRAFVDLTSFSPATPPGAAGAGAVNPALGGGNPVGGPTAAGNGALSTLLSKAGFDSLLLLLSAVILLVSSLGVLLACKIVLGVLLATGPIFIALLLFEGTRGVFEGWLRASLAFAFAPLAVTLILGVALTMLEPTLEQVEAMRGSNVYLPGVAFAAMVLVTVFAGVAIAAVIAAGVVAAGFRLPGPGPDRRDAQQPGGAMVVIPADRAPPGRAARIARSLVAQGRRDQAPPAFAPGLAQAAGERRTMLSATLERGPRDVAVAARLGQSARRGASPRTVRRGQRSET